MEATKQIAAQPAEAEKRGIFRRLLSVPELGAGLGVVVFLVIFDLFDNTIISGPSLARMLITAAPTGITACGMMFLMLAGEMDLASGGTAGLAGGAIAGYLTATAHIPEWQGLVLGLIAAVLIGCLNSFTTIKLGMPSFFATMISSFLLLGIVTAIFHGQYFMVKTVMPLTTSLYIKSPGLGLPWTVWIFLIMILIGELAVRYTKLGPVLKATGGNKRAAQAAGINTALVKTLCFIFVAICAFVGGLFVISAGQVADGSIGLEWNLWVIAAAIIGGCSISGGIGSMFGVLLGLFLIQVVKAGLGAVHLQNNAQNMVVGSLLIVAATLDVLRRRTQQY